MAVKRRAILGILALTVSLTVSLAVSLAVPASAADKTFDSAGVEIHYVDRGEGEAVVLIHGYAGSAAMHWAGLIPLLAKDHRVLALDCRGHGASGKPHDPRAYGVQMVEDVVRLLDHEGIARAHVVGYSMGGLLTVKLVVTHPDRVISAIPGGFGWSRAGAAGGLGFVDRLADSLEKGEGFGPLMEALTPAGAPPPDPDRVKAMDAMLSSMNDVKALAAVARSWKDLTVTEEQLRANRVPTLFLIGSKDPLKAGVDALDGVMAHAKIRVFDGTDHMTTAMRPDFTTAIVDFLAEHRADAEGAAAGAPVPAGAEVGSKPDHD